MIINKKELLDALKIANKVVSKSSGFAVLSCIKLDGKNAVIQATDLETGVEIPLEMPRTDEVCVLSARQLKDIVGSLESDGVNIKIKVEDEAIHVNINGLFEIFGMPVDEFPEFNTPKDTQGYATIRKAALKNVLPAVTREESGFKLSGVYFDAEQEKAVATDGHRLHMEPVGISGKSFMLSGATLGTVVSCLGKDEDEITFKSNSKRVIEREASDPPDKGALNGLKKDQLINLADDYFVGLSWVGDETVANIRGILMAEMKKASEPVYSEDTKAVVVKTEKATFAIRPLEVKFPDYMAVIPTKAKHLVTVKRGDFLPAINQSLTMSNAQYRAVRLTFNGKGTIEMESVNPDIGTYQRLTVPMTGHVDPQVEAGYNPTFLKAIMDVTKDNDAEFEVGVNSSSLPLTFNHGSFEGLVMPMRV